MNVWLLRAGMVLALAFVALTFTNASWLAAAPRGKVKQVAMGGVGQYPLGPEDCGAAIEQPVHDYLANTVASAVQARRMAPLMIEIDVVATADGRIAAFGDDTLDCLTDAKGPVKAKSLAELQRLDIAHSYSADGGKTFPLRGKGVGAMPAIEDMLKILPEKAILYRFASDAESDADQLVGALKSAGRDSVKRKDGFRGTAAQMARVRAAFPGAWTWDDAAADDCSSQYALYGWTGTIPQSCKGGTMVIPLDGQWKIWGFPNRLIARMEAAGGKIVMTGPAGGGENGIVLPEQIGEIPSSYNGYLLVADIWNIAPAIHESLDGRTYMEVKRAEEGLARRRAKQ